MLYLQTKELRDGVALLHRHIATEIVQLKTISTNCLAIMGATPYDRGIAYINCRAEEFNHFGISIERLNKICIGRGNLQLQLVGNELRFGSEGKHYRGQIGVLTAEDITISSPTNPISPNEFKHIAKHYLPRLKLSDIQGNRELAIMLRYYTDGLELAVTDLLHAAIIKTRMNLQLNQNLPLSLGLKLSTLLIDEKSGYVIANNSLYCWNQQIKLQHAIIGELIESTQVIDIMKKLAAPLATAKIDIGILRNICHNLHAVYEDSSVVVIESASDGLNLTCSTSNGTITDKLTTEVKLRTAKLSINVNFSVIMDILDGALQSGIALLEFRPSINNQVILCLRYAIDNETEVVYYIIGFAI